MEFEYWRQRSSLSLPSMLCFNRRAAHFLDSDDFIVGHGHRTCLLRPRRLLSRAILPAFHSLQILELSVSILSLAKGRLDPPFTPP